MSEYYGILLDPTSQGTNLSVGERVEVADKNGLDEPYDGIQGNLKGFSRPHGYAVLQVNHWANMPNNARRNPLLVHPENIRLYVPDVAKGVQETRKAEAEKVGEGDA